MWAGRGGGKLIWAGVGIWGLELAGGGGGTLIWAGKFDMGGW